jgi:hypothetical protein
MSSARQAVSFMTFVADQSGGVVRGVRSPKPFDHRFQICLSIFSQFLKILPIVESELFLDTKNQVDQISKLII